MTFNVFEMETEKAVDNAFMVLSGGGVVLEPIHALPWSGYCVLLSINTECAGGSPFNAFYVRDIKIRETASEVAAFIKNADTKSEFFRGNIFE